MVEQQQDTGSDGIQVRNHSKNLSTKIHTLSPPPPPSPQIVMDSDGGRMHMKSIDSPDASWGVLIAISEKAKSRPQGTQIFLHDDEHVFGRLVKDPSYRFDSVNVSGKHCTIFRRKLCANENRQGSEIISGENWLVYVKDSSSNGTFINCQRLKKDSPEARIKDGDIISLVNAPEHENAFAFLYQELKSNVQTPLKHQPNVFTASALKRKALHDGEGIGEYNPGDNKRSKGLGIGGPDGPVSLDDVRRLQRSNEELRKQLEAHLLTIDKLRTESRATAARHDAEIKELRETLSASFLNQIQELRSEIAKKDKELEISNSLCTEQQTQLEDRDRSLASAIQSRKDADEVIKSQKLNIFELKEQLEDEQIQRRSEREKAEADLKAAVERVRSEALEELKRQSESSTQQLREQLEMINKLKEADQESRSLIEALRHKLDTTREALVEVERTSRTLELRLQDEEVSLVAARKKLMEKEKELQSAKQDLQNEKVAKEEALARLSSLEAEMETAIHDLSVEQQRLQGARERIVLRETQLRAFHSTAEEVAALQQKQQEQLKEMMRVLEDGEEEVQVTFREQCNGLRPDTNKVELDTETRRKDGDDATQQTDESGDNETVNNEQEKYMSDASSQATESSAHSGPSKEAIKPCEDEDTQIDESVSAHDCMPENEHNEIETQVIGNGADESGQNKDFGGENTQLVVGDNTQLLDIGVNAKDTIDTDLLVNGRSENLHVVHSGDGIIEAGSSNMQGIGTIFPDNNIELKECNVEARIVDTKHELGRFEGKSNDEGEDSIVVSEKHVPVITLDLMTCEAAGSWAYNTPPSVHCNNVVWPESHMKIEGEDMGVSEVQHHDFDASQVGDSALTYSKKGKVLGNSESSLVSGKNAAWHEKERRDLNVMLDIVAPDFSRLHGLDKVMETAPDSEEHTEEEEEEEEEDEMRDSDDSVEDDSSEPVSQSHSVSARY